MKLFRVKLQGMNNYGIGTNYGESYVVATDPTSAYEKVKAFLDKNDLGFTHERRLESVTLLADEEQYAEKNMLFIQKTEDLGEL